jgi:hypothetical protein
LIKDIIKVKRLEKGYETYVDGEKYPIRGCFKNEKCVLVHQVKRLIPTIFKTAKNPIGIIYLWMNWKTYLDYIYFVLRDVYYQSVKYYSQPVREIYRLIKSEKIRDIVCAILEFDPGYRYPFQNIIGELNKDNFEKNPIKELKRLLGLLKKRGGDYFHNKVQVDLILLLLIVSPNIKRKLKEIVRELNIDEIKFSVEDEYWSKRMPSNYKF